MLKQTAAVAAIFTLFLTGIGQATPEQAPSASAASPSRESHVSKPVIEDAGPGSTSKPSDLSPITLNPRDWPNACPRDKFPLDPQAVANIPTWPSYYESLQQVPPSRYAASYSWNSGPAPVLHGVKNNLNVGNSVPWGSNVVPKVEVLPAPVPRK